MHIRRQEGNAGGYPGRRNPAGSAASAPSGGQRGGGDKDLPVSPPDPLPSIPTAGGRVFAHALP